jgi:acetyl esterase/lipase
VRSASTPWAQPSAEDIEAIPTSGCGVVRYTPPTASAPHDGDLCRPATPRGQAVLLVHGGGGYSGDRSGLEPWSRWYRSQGFVTFAVDYTLVGDGSATPVYPSPERDIKAAVQYLRRMSPTLGIDPDGIVVHGSSEGARLGAQVLVTPGDPWFRSPDLWPDVPDHVNGLIGFYGYYDGSSLVADQYFGGDAGSTDPAVIERRAHADSVAQAGAATGPVLLFHGDVDGLIDVSQTERFGRALAEAGTPVTTHILLDENHAFDQRPGDPFTDVGRIAAREILAWIATALPER